MDFMKATDALAIVIDLANENVLEEEYCDDLNLKEERNMQLQAVDVSTKYLECLRGILQPFEELI